MPSDFYETDLVCHRCEASLWDYVGEFVDRRGRREDVIGCAFCGLMTRVPFKLRSRPADPNDEPADTFRFQFGRFAGMTLAEADAQPNGRRYIELMRDRNEKLRPKIEAFLAAAAPSAQPRLRTATSVAIQ